MMFENLHKGWKSSLIIVIVGVIAFMMLGGFRVDAQSDNVEDRRVACGAAEIHGEYWYPLKSSQRLDQTWLDEDSPRAHFYGDGRTVVKVVDLETFLDQTPDYPRGVITDPEELFFMFMIWAEEEDSNGGWANGCGETFKLELETSLEESVLIE